MEAQIEKKDSLIRALQQQVEASGLEGIPYTQIAREASGLFPEVDELYVSRGAAVRTDSLGTSLGTLIIAKTVSAMKPEREQALGTWLRLRLNDQSVMVRTELHSR